MKSTKITAEEALALIRDERAIARTIVSDPVDDHHWDFLLKQWKDPAARPAPRELEPGADPTCVLDFYRNTWVTQSLQAYADYPEGATQLFSGTLLPSDGRMYLYNRAKVNESHENVAILFDAGVNPDRYLLAPPEEKIDTSNEPCIIKACFAQDAGTNMQWWIKGQPLHAYHNNHYPQAISFESLRGNNRELRNRLGRNLYERNEVLFHARPQSVSAIAVLSKILTYDDSSAKGCNAIYRKLLVLVEQHIDVPLLILDGDSNVEEYTKEDQARDLVDQTKKGNIFVNKIHALVERLNGEEPAFWQAYLTVMQVKIEEWKDYYFRDSVEEGNLKSLYARLLEVVLYKKNKKVTWQELVDDHGLDKDWITKNLFLFYARGSDLALRCIEILEARNGCGWKEWGRFKTILSLYGQYLKSLHRFPSRYNGAHFYNEFYQKVSDEFDKDGCYIDKNKAGLLSFIYKSSEPLSADKISEAFRHHRIEKAFTTRLLWTNIVSYTDEYYSWQTTRLNQATKAVLTRLQKLNIPGDHAKILKQMVTYLQERSVIRLAFDAKKMIQGKLSALEALNYAAAAEERINPNRGDDYADERKKTEDLTFSYLPLDLKFQFEKKEHARPRYAFFCLQPSLDMSPLPTQAYGKSYVVLQHKVKFNSLFVTENIYANRKQALEQKNNEYKVPTPSTYFTLEVFIQQMDEHTFLGLVDAVTGLIPVKRLQYQPHDMQAYIPPVNLFDSAVTKEFFIHPDEYVLTPTEKSWIEKQGIDVVNTGGCIGERYAKELTHIVHTDNVDALQHFCDQHPTRKTDILNGLIPSMIERRSVAIYDYLKQLKMGYLDISVIATYAKNAETFWIFYQILEKQSQALLLLDEYSAQYVLALLLKAATNLEHNAELIRHIVYALPVNPWEAVDVVAVEQTFKKKLLAIFHDHQHLEFMQFLQDSLYFELDDLVEHYFDFICLGVVFSMSFDPDVWRSILNTPKMQEKIRIHIAQRNWQQLDNLMKVIPSFNIPLLISAQETILDSLQSCHFMDRFLPLCKDTPEFFTVFRPEVLRLLLNAANSSTDMFNALYDYFPEEFVQCAPTVIREAKSINNANFELLISVCDFTKFTQDEKISVIKRASIQKSVHYLLDEVHADLSETEFNAIVTQISKNPAEGFGTLKRFLNCHQENGQLVSGILATDRLHVFEEKAPTTEALAKGLCALAIRIKNGLVTFDAYAQKIEAIISHYSEIEQQTLCGCLVGESHIALLQKDIAVLIANFKFCASFVWYNPLYNPYAYPDLMVAFLKVYPDDANACMLLGYLLDPMSARVQEVKDFLVKYSDYKFDTETNLFDRVMRYDNPDKDLVALILERSPLAHLDLAKAARHAACEEILPLMLRTDRFNSESLLSALKVVLRNPDATILLPRLFFSKIQTNADVVTPDKVRCWLLVLKHPDFSELKVLMQTVLSSAALQAGPGVTLFLTRELNSILSTESRVNKITIVKFLIEHGAQYTPINFTKMLEMGDTLFSSLVSSLKTQKRQAECVPILFAQCYTYLSADNYEALHHFLQAIQRQPELKCDVELTALLMTVLSMNKSTEIKSTVVSYFIRCNLVSQSMDLLNYLVAKYNETTIPSEVDPLAVQLARACHWSMLCLYIPYVERKCPASKTSKIVKGLAFMQYGEAFFQEYGLTERQQEPLRSHIASRIRCNLGSSPDREAGLWDDLRKQDYVAACCFIHALQFLLDEPEIKGYFHILESCKNPVFSLNLDKPSLSEVETSCRLMEESIIAVKTEGASSDILLHKIPIIIQCVYALAKLDTPKTHPLLASRVRCIELLMQARDLLVAKAQPEEKASANEESAITEETVTKIVNEYHHHKLHLFGRRDWVVNQDKNTSALLEKLEDKAVPLTAKQQLLKAAVTGSNKVDITLFKVINRNSPVVENNGHLRGRRHVI